MIVVKVGGSLLDHPPLGAGLRRWLQEQSDRCLLIPGGGPAADVIRQYHRIHQLPEEFSHWQAIRMMDVNGHLLRHLVDNAADVMDVFSTCEHDVDLEHSWRVTSDAIAARIAEVRGIRELLMLKSVDLPNCIGWAEAAERGLVDHSFGEIVERSAIRVRWVNFRRLLEQIV